MLSWLGLLYRRPFAPVTHSSLWVTAKASLDDAPVFAPRTSRRSSAHKTHRHFRTRMISPSGPMSDASGLLPNSPARFKIPDDLSIFLKLEARPVTDASSQ